VFFDEFGCLLQERPGRTWAPTGQRPVLRQVMAERRGLSTAVGLTLSGKIYKRHFRGGMNSDDARAALEHVRRHLSGKWVLIWDHAGIHTSRKTRAYLAGHPEILVEWLPAYAPELNPEEYCHGNAKQHLRNATVRVKDDLRHLLNRNFARLRRRPDLLLSFVHAAGLSVRQLWLT
jgi:transposase